MIYPRAGSPTVSNNRMSESPTRLILASASPRRLALLEQMGIIPERLLPADVDETPAARELPRTLAKRLARAKAEAAREILRDEDEAPAIVLAADTVVAVGRRILPKPGTVEEAADALSLLSGRNHRVFSALCLITPEGKRRQKISETRLRFKRISKIEFEAYLASGEWRGKAGGYAIQGLAGSFVIRLAGSYTGVVGLPLYETLTMLQGAGYPVTQGWQDA